MTKLQKGGARFGRGPFNFFAFVSSDQINLGKLTGQDRHSRSANALSFPKIYPDVLLMARSFDPRPHVAVLDSAGHPNWTKVLSISCGSPLAHP
jgi:hypothetical protein